MKQIKLTGRSYWPTITLLKYLFIVIELSVIFDPALCQRHSLQNTPPVLYVPDRNWRISETEQVGQIIARVRAEDAENDDLEFGLEPHFHSNYGNANDDSSGIYDKLPFRIDPVDGVVYLNETLLGRGGENFFLYITVSDGILTAKNEVFVNVLKKGDKKKGNASSSSSFSSVSDISQFLPSFESLPGVQSIRNRLPSRRPTNSLPPGLGFNRPYAGDTSMNRYPVIGFEPNQKPSLWPPNSSDEDEISQENQLSNSQTTTSSSANVALQSNRTKLTPLREPFDAITNASTTSKSSPVNGSSTPNYADKKTLDRNDATTSNNHSIRAVMIPVIVAVCGLFVAAAAIMAFLFRKRLCTFGKKKKSKEEMAKKSNQSNLSSNLTDDSRNSMVMQHWSGPIAYGNRYVPWERDQQQQLQQGLATSQLSTSFANGNNGPIDGCAPHAIVSGGVGLPNGAAGMMANGSGCANNSNNRQGNDRWEFPRHRLKFFNILGEGAFGQVWRCEAIDIDGMEGVTTVAVKTLKENAAEVEKKDLMSELEVMKSLEPHVNVVRLLGCCTDKDPIFVIIEYVNRGKLQTYLRNSRAERHYGNTHGKSNILTSSDLTSFMYQVAKGMDYLTSRGIIHRDLAARNILITDDHTCKVADFGFARDVITSKIYERKSEGKLPIRWMATESLYDNIFSVKSDIWSFGILMWEIVTLGSTPYPGISAADVMRKVRDGYRLEKPEHCRRELYNIMYYCWSDEPKDRPTFSELVNMLDKLLHTEMDYIELERFPDHNYYNIINLSGEKL